MFVSSVLKKSPDENRSGACLSTLLARNTVGSHHNSSGVTRARLMREEDVTEIRLYCNYCRLSSIVAPEGGLRPLLHQRHRSH